MDCCLDEAVKKRILTKADAAFLVNHRIPAKDGIPDSRLWRKLLQIQDKMDDAIQSGRIKKLKYEAASESKKFYVISDHLGEGASGVLNPVDGKKYDSKSAYYRTVKEAGCYVMGNDAPTSDNRKPQKIDWKQAVAEACNKAGI